MKNFFALQLEADQVAKSVNTQVGIDPDLTAYLNDLVSNGHAKNRAQAMKFIYAALNNDTDKLQIVLRNQQELAKLIGDLKKIGKIINVPSDIHNALMAAKINPEEAIHVFYDALINGNADSLESLLAELGRGIHNDDQKRAVAAALGHIVEPRVKNELKIRLNQWLSQSDRPSSALSGPEARTNFEIDEEDFQALATVLEKAVIKGKPAIIRAIGEWMKNDRNIINALHLPQTQANKKDGTLINPEDVVEPPAELVQQIYDVLAERQELANAYNSHKKTSRRNFMKIGLGSFALGGVTMGLINALIKAASNDPDKASQGQEAKLAEKYQQQTIEFIKGRNATYKFDHKSNSLTITVTPKEEDGNPFKKLAVPLLDHIQKLGYKVTGNPNIQEEDHKTVITIKCEDDGKAQPMSDLIRFDIANSHKKEWYTPFREWYAGKSERLASDFIKEFKSQPVQVHVLQALMSHELYRGHSASEILNLPIPPYLEKDVQEYLGVTQ